jgi:hypothetical protein
MGEKVNRNAGTKRGRKRVSGDILGRKEKRQSFNETVGSRVVTNEGYIMRSYRHKNSKYMDVISML